MVRIIPARVAARPLWISGHFYDVRTDIGPASAGTAALTANTLYASPLWVPKAGQAIDRIGVHVDTAGAADTVARLLIYADDGDFLPGAILLDAGTVEVDGTGAKDITISEALPYGWVFPAVVSDGTPTLRTVNQSGQAPYGVSAMGGFSMWGSPNVSATVAEPPDPFGTPTGFLVNTFTRVGVRAA